MAKTNWNKENWCRCGAYLTRNPGEPWLDAFGCHIITLMGERHEHHAKYFNKDWPQYVPEENESDDARS